MCVVQDSFKHWTAARRRIDYPIRECPVWRKATGRSGSKAPIRFLKQRPFDQLFCAWGHQSLSAHFVDFFTAVATTSNVCSASWIQPVEATDWLNRSASPPRLPGSGHPCWFLFKEHRGRGEMVPPQDVAVAEIQQTFHSDSQRCLQIVMNHPSSTHPCAQ